MHAHTLLRGAIVALFFTFGASSPLPVSELAPATTQATARKPTAIETHSVMESEERSSPAVLEERSSSYTGRATWYTQDGNAGSCGKVYPNSAIIVAMNTPQVNGGSHCWKKVNIVNTANGKRVTAMVADECPGCGYGSLDLSTAAFNKIGAASTGVLKIKWSFA